MPKFFADDPGSQPLVAYGRRHPVLYGLLAGLVCALWGAILFHFRWPAFWVVFGLVLSPLFWWIVRPGGLGEYLRSWRDE